MKIQAPAPEKNQLHFPKITVLRGRSGIFNLNFPGGPFAPGADTIFCPRLGDEIAVIQRLASCGPRPSAPRHSHPHRPCPGLRGHSRVPDAPRSSLTWSGLPWLGSHSLAFQVHQRARPPGSLRPHRAQHRPQPSAVLPGRLCAPGRRVLSSASSAPPPPPGASASAEPDGHPGTGGRRASRTSLELRERRCPPPPGTVGSPETKGCVGTARRGVPARSSSGLRGRCERRSAPLEVPKLAGTPPQAPRWYGPPLFKGSALRRRCLQLGRVQTRTTETPALGLGPRGPAAVRMCREWEHQTTALAASGRRCRACLRKHQRSASKPSSTLLSVLKVPRNKCLCNDFPLGATCGLHRRQPFREVPLIN